MKFLPNEEVKDLADRYKNLAANKTERINHDTTYCSGESNSLSISRKDDGTLVMYCHRCGKLGVASENFRRVAAIKRSDNHSGESCYQYGESICIPSQSNQQFSQWPVQARHWYRKHGITDSEVKAYGLHFNEKSRRIIIPIYQDGELISYQSRKIFDDDPYPKYLTVTKNKSKSFWKKCDKEEIKDVVLVEDVLSGIKVGRNNNVVALTGVNLSDYLMNYLSKFDRFFIWLDDDKPEVKLKQVQLKNRLGLWGEVYIIKTDNDPKTYTDEEISNELKTK